MTDTFASFTEPTAHCQHPKCQPKWDAEACEGKSAEWIREHYPRFAGVCPDCGARVIVYADSLQYILGDY